MASEIKYNEFLDEDLKKEVLIDNQDFLSDAMSFLEKRTGQSDFESEEDVFDAYMEHMRYHDTNEVTAVRDLMYAQEADDADKEEFGRLLDTFDRMEGESFMDAAGDYIAAGVTSPSTWLGLVTGGAGKMTGVAAQQAAKTGVRAVLGNVMRKAITAPSVAKGMAVEGAIGLGTGAAQESTRVETGAQEEFTGGRTLLTGATQALAGALPAGISGAQQSIMAKRATKIRESGLQAMGEAAEKAEKNVKRVLSQTKDKARVQKTQDEILTDKVKEARKFLDSTTGSVKEGLPQDKVAEGMAILRDLSPTETMIASLDDQTVDAITAAAIKLGDEIDVKPGERITSAVSRAMEDGKLTTQQMDDIMQEFNLTSDQFSYMYMAELSRAGRTLANASKIARERGLTAEAKKQKVGEAKEAEAQLKRLAGAVSDYMNQAGSGLTKQEAIDIAKSAGKSSKVRNAFQEADRFRLAMMTGQLATTVRNVAGGSFRIATDVFDKSFKALFSLGKDYDDPLAVAKYAFFNQAEAKVVREMFQKTMPVESEKFFATFFDTATATAKLGGESPATRTGAVVNTLNRLSDNMYKQAIFAGRLDQLTRKQMDKPLSEIIAEGKFAQIEKGMIKDAIEESLDFVYQATPKGDNFAAEAGRTLLDMHRKLPFVVSSLVPFPRFVINQFDFVAQHMPVFGMMTNKIQKDRVFDAESLAKQTSGLAMLSIAYDMRERNGVESEWYEYITDEGDVIDMRPIAGPFNAFLLGADAIYRYKQGTDHKSISGIIKDGWQALGGPSFRAGTGLSTIDKLFEDVDSQGFEQSSARWIGDTLNTFTLPLATFRDFGSLSDEESRLVPETGYVDFFDIIAARATRSLPEIPGISLSETISEEYGTGQVQLGKERPDILTGEPLRSVDPLERQIFGTGKRAPKNALQRKLSELQMSAYEIYKPSDFPFEDRLMREFAGGRLSSELNKIVQTEEFNNLTAKQQKTALRDRAKKVLRDVNKGVKERLQSPEYAQFRFERLESRLRADVREQYEKQYPEDEEMDYNKALQLVPGVKQRAEGAGFSKGGLIDDILGSSGTDAATKQTDELLDEADTATDADYADELITELDDDIPDDAFLEDYFSSDISDDEAFLSPQTKQQLEAVGDVALEVLIGSIPVVGDVYDAANVTMALNDKRYVDAAIDAIGFVPVLGNVMKTGVKATVDMFSAADPVVKRKALNEFVREEGRVPDLSDEADLQDLSNIGAKQEKILAGAASQSDPDMPLFHGTRSRVDELIEPKEFVETTGGKGHSELSTASLSTSRDPLLSAETFQEKSGVPVEEMFVLRPKRGLMAREDMSPREYDDLRDLDGYGPRMERMSDELRLPTRLPKSGHTEAETMIQNLEDVDITKLKDNPELLAKVKRGQRELAEVRGGLDQADTLSAKLLDPDYKFSKEVDGFNVPEGSTGKVAGANIMYNTMRSTLKKALGLGAYTSGAGARGKYDQILNDITMGDAYDDVRKGMKKARELLGDTQKGKQMGDLIEAMDDYETLMMDTTVSASEVASELAPIKKRIMDITNKMNRGGLASRR